MPALTELTFEQALQELEETVAKLEAGDLTLEQSLALYERGQELAAACDELLAQAALRVARLSAAGEEVPASLP